MIRILTSATLLFAAQAAWADGRLVIVGGGLKADNAEVHQAFLKGLKDGETIAIIPAASASPSQSAAAMRDQLVRYGADPARVQIVHVATEDDAGTPDINEADWHAGGYDADEIKKVRTAGAIWFTGGDQARIVATLKGVGGAESPMLTVLRARLKAGTTIGGTSAGAAIMSRPMIAGGEVMPTLLHGMDAATEGHLEMAMGLGFLPFGLVDQHFDQRARLGRLARALGTLANDQRIGFGIDEDTALVVDLDAGRADILGRGAVTVLDMRAAQLADRPGGAFACQGAVLSVLTAHDGLSLWPFTPIVAAYKKPTIGHEYVTAALPEGGGMAVPYPGMAEFLGERLLDNKAATDFAAISFDQTGAGVRYRFHQTGASIGYWGKGPDGTARYSLHFIGFDIEPVQISISDIKLETKTYE